MGGLELLMHLRVDAALRDLRVVMTASASEVKVWQARDTGASAYQPKLVDPAEVRALLTLR